MGKITHKKATQFSLVPRKGRQSWPVSFLVSPSTQGTEEAGPEDMRVSRPQETSADKCPIPPGCPLQSRLSHLADFLSIENREEDCTELESVQINK